MNLTELAARWGIEASYLDIQGRHQIADEATLRRIVEALSAAGNPPAAARRSPSRNPGDSDCDRRGPFDRRDLHR